MLRDSALVALTVSRAGRTDLLRFYADEEGASEVARLRDVAATDPDPQLRARAARLLRDVEER